ncbi:thioredoxin family protein [Chamaesiphon sp. VAR_48_metabat_135_sub]|uniref:thioredoxin family protein n=1 Tax=Chamaesiphon sp. VAR_48_metabat_135_sub TaxID=2964699 RepID=UPI0037BFAFB7
MSSVTVINDAQFESEVLQADLPVLVYLWAAWCGPCRLVSPSIDWIATSYADRVKVVKMEIDPNPETVKAYKVEGVPAIRLFKGDEMIYSWEGAITKDKLTTMLDSNL